MRIFLAADHGGLALKEELKKWLSESGHEVRDFGCHSPEAVDYPDLALLVAQAVAGAERGGGEVRGIVCDTIGQASCMAANKVPGIRAVVGFDLFAVRSSREHNDANVLCLGGGTLGPALARSLVGEWLKTPFMGGRHARRLEKITEIERLYGRGVKEQR